MSVISVGFLTTTGERSCSTLGLFFWGAVNVGGGPFVPRHPAPHHFFCFLTLMGLPFEDVPLSPLPEPFWGLLLHWPILWPVWPQTEHACLRPMGHLPSTQLLRFQLPHGSSGLPGGAPTPPRENLAGGRTSSARWAHGGAAAALVSDRARGAFVLGDVGERTLLRT